MFHCPQTECCMFWISHFCANNSDDLVSVGEGSKRESAIDYRSLGTAPRHDDDDSRNDYDDSNGDDDRA